MPISLKHLTLAESLVKRFSTLDAVEAIAIGGSVATGVATDASDMDIYVYVSRELTQRQRLDMIESYATKWQHVDYWGAGDVFFDAHTGIEVDVVYFNTAWMSEQVARTLDRHEAWMGYTTAFWHTCKISTILFDRSNWFHTLHTKAQCPYPSALAHNIVKLNYPVLSEIVPSYRKQLKSAIARNDLLSINHRLAAFFASYFDIIFAVNHVLHPGEKRQLEQAVDLCKSLPNNMVDNVTQVLQLASRATPDLLTALDTLLNRLTEWLIQKGYLMR